MRQFKGIKSTVVNDPDNLPVIIKVLKMKSFEKRGVKKSFLIDLLVNEYNPYGVIRDTYFIVNVKERIRHREDSESLRSYSVIMDRMRARGYTYLMINF